MCVDLTTKTINGVLSVKTITRERGMEKIKYIKKEK